MSNKSFQISNDALEKNNIFTFFCYHSSHTRFKPHQYCMNLSLTTSGLDKLLSINGVPQGYELGPLLFIDVGTHLQTIIVTIKEQKIWNRVKHFLAVADDLSKLTAMSLKQKYFT